MVCRWSALGPVAEPGNYAARGAIGPKIRIQITQEIIDAVAQCGGDPLLELSDAALSSETIRLYVVIGVDPDA